MQQKTGTLYDRIVNTYRFDLRSFAISRMALGLVLIYDYLVRLTDLTAHYTDDGVLPLHTLFSYMWKGLYIPLHALSGSFNYELILFLIGILAAFSFAIGYKTRIATIVSWVLLCSLHNRNPLILQSGDDLLRMALFWGMFLPWSKKYSLDALKNPTTESNQFSSLAAIAFMIQVASVYFFSGVQKSPVEWWENATAIYYALSIDQMVLPFGRWLLALFEETKWLTRIVYVSEFLLPLLYFVPFKNNVTRFITCISLILFHIAINLVLFIGLFSVIGIAVNLALLPSFVFGRDKISDTIQQLPHTIYQKVQKGILVLLMIYVLLWNIGNTSYTTYEISDAMKYPAYMLRLDQNWGMFAPSVFKNDGWYVMPAQTMKGDTIDLYRNGQLVSYEKPLDVLGEIKNDRWRKYNEQVLLNAWCRKDYCHYILTNWNREHPERVCRSIDLVYVSEPTQPFGELQVRKTLFLEHFTLR